MADMFSPICSLFDLICIGWQGESKPDEQRVPRKVRLGIFTFLADSFGKECGVYVCDKCFKDAPDNDSELLVMNYPGEALREWMNRSSPLTSKKKVKNNGKSKKEQG